LRWTALILIVMAGMYNLVGNDWRRMGFSLAIEFMAIFLFASLNIPFSLALVKLLEGWMAIAILATTLSTLPFINKTIFDYTGSQVNEADSFSAKLFRILLAALMAITIVVNITFVHDLFLMIDRLQTVAGLLMLGYGILMCSFRQTIFSSAIGLLTFMGGFEVLFVALEPSVLLLGLLAGVDLAIASLCAWLIFIQSGANE
ncbi:MAG: hypothetical protein ACPL0B_03925, partial [Anaerolineales bacterium]